MPADSDIIVASDGRTADNESGQAKRRDESQVVLRLQGISKVYPGTVALQHIDMEILRGETHGIIGKNGAGKSTLVGIIAGLITPSEGAVELHGHTYSDLSRIAARKESVSIVPQEPQLVQECTIAENLFMPDYPTRRRGTLVDWTRLEADARRIVEKAGLNLDVRTVAGDLGVGLQQVLLMLKASYVEQSEIIILDEAFASLSEREEELFYAIMRERKAAGCTILHISHRIDELLQVCDRMTVLRDGRSVKTVERSEVDRESLATLIVGGETAAVATAADAADAESEAPASVASTSIDAVDRDSAPLLAVDNLTSLDHFHEISFTVRRNEVVGIAGLMGSGRTSLMKTIFGIYEPVEGSVRIDGKPAAISGPATALKEGVVYLPEERDLEGLIANLDVRTNSVLSALRRVVRRFVIDHRRENDLARDLTRTLEVKYASLEQEVRELSGGNRQKVVVAKVFSTQPKVFLLDEPTKGIDIAARAGLLRIIRKKLARNAAILVSAPGLEELIEICDRILVLHRGRIVAEYERNEFEEETLYHAIQGGTVQ